MEVIPASVHKNRQIVLVVMYQFLDFHGLKMWQKSKVEGTSVGASTASNAKVNNLSVYTEFNFF